MQIMVKNISADGEGKVVCGRGEGYGTIMMENIVQILIDKK